MHDDLAGDVAPIWRYGQRLSDMLCVRERELSFFFFHIRWSPCFD